MDLLPMVAAPIATITLLRAIWLFVRARRKHASGDIDNVRSAALSWIRRAAAHFVGNSLKRQWQLHYALDKYTQSLYEQHEKLVVPGRVELSIDRCYIPLELRAGQMTEGIQLLAKSGTVLLLGDPGTGKSALLSMLIRTMCRSRTENSDTARLPIYLTLQQLVPYLTNEESDLKPEDALRILSSWFNDFAVGPLGLFESSDMVETFAKSSKNGLLVLFDGLDEIDREVIGKVERFVVVLTQYLSAAPGKNLLIVAGRRQALDFAPRLVAGDIPKLVSVELKPFSPAAIYAFLLRWPYGPGMHGVDEARRIFSQLRLNPTLIETCSNPLALALYVNHYLRLKELGRMNGFSQPETRAAFFSDVIDHLMIRTRMDPSGAASTRPFRHARTNFFVQVVDEHIRSAEPFNRISETVLHKHANNLVRSGQSAQQALEDLAKDTGIIIENRADHTWRFIHRSFLDYFLACSLASVSQQRAITDLLQNLHKHPLRYLEGFYLACGLMASRNSLQLPALLHDVGRSAFVGNFYPRAMLEAQAYFLPEFPERIRFYAKRWRTNPREESLLRDLTSVLVDYEHSCEALDRTPDVTMVGELGESDKAKGVSVLQAAQLNLAFAVKLSRREGMTEILLASSVEDAIVALYEPNVAGRLEQEEINADPRLASLVAEAALRSSLLSGNLAPMDGRSLAQRRPLARAGEAWADTWPVRGSRLGATLAIALPYMRSLTVTERSKYPHLSTLLYVKPIRHLRYEVLFGDRRLSGLLLSIVILGLVGVGLIGVPFLGLLICAFGLAMLCYLVTRYLVLQGLAVLPSCRALNLQPIGVDFELATDSRVRLIIGTRGDIPKWMIRTPRSREGQITALYFRTMPFVWRRFSTTLGDRKLGLIAGAFLQQMWTEDVRRLLRS